MDRGLLLLAQLIIMLRAVYFCKLCFSSCIYCTFNYCFLAYTGSVSVCFKLELYSGTWLADYGANHCEIHAYDLRKRDWANPHDVTDRRDG
ncbi:hypothetical protein BV22DRAFT_487578 [Leucogyrophana mollusca]|uniref:Uncharacterized protein n=1 Tax=Leucogyrophana mollusca TaxID=85980 RepID=A0ACB8BIV1_9AGAM|nr:hypothetical protein BV22DRAFT_487578 [Leucogyrophana mollusca]